MFEYNDQGLAAVVSDATVQLSYSFARSRATVFQGEWTYGLHTGCRHASGVACHFHPHFDCEASQDFQQPEFESHPRDVIPAEYSGRGSFWWYAHLSHYLLQENFDFQLKVPPSLSPRLLIVSFRSLLLRRSWAFGAPSSECTCEMGTTVLTRTTRGESALCTSTASAMASSRTLRGSDEFESSTASPPSS